MKITIISAMDPNNTIWKNNDLPRWRKYPEDLKRFKKITSEKTIIMWSKTFRSIWKELPNRRNIVLSRKWNIDWIETYNSIENILKQLLDEEMTNCKSCNNINNPKETEIFIIWWAMIYKEFLNKADYLDITEIKKEYQWDTFFPKFKHLFKEISREQHQNIDFVKYKKKPNKKTKQP